MTAAFVCIVPKPVESCWFENHGFTVFLGVVSSGMSASASSFFRFSSRALHLV
jgi:predicted ATPase